MLKVVKQTTTVLTTQALLLGVLPVMALGATFNLEEATVADINAVFDAGALTSENLTQLYLNRIDAYDKQGPTLNSLITVNPNALETAKALDLEITTGGSDTLAGSIPPDDAFTVKQFREAGAIILGKANLSEFALTAGWI